MSVDAGMGRSSAPRLPGDPRALAMNLQAGLLAKSVLEAGKEEECGVHGQGPEL